MSDLLYFSRIADATEMGQRVTSFVLEVHLLNMELFCFSSAEALWNLKGL